jgi:hypothetical protein
MFVDGNAENIIYVVNEETNVATELFHDRSSRIKIYMENNKLKEYVSIRKVDGKVYPVAQLTPEKEFLPGFIWKPEDRPKSKADLLNRKRSVAKEEVKTPEAESKEGKPKEKSIKNIEGDTDDQVPEIDKKQTAPKEKIQKSENKIQAEKAQAIQDSSAVKSVSPIKESTKKIRP